MYQFDENGVLIPGSFQPGINSSGYGMSQDPNAVPPIPGVTIPQISTPMSPNLVAAPEPGILDKAGAMAKKAGNLTEQQAAALGKLMEAPRMPNAPAAAAAIPRGPQGNMQQLQMGAPGQRKTLAQLLYR